MPDFDWVWQLRSWLPVPQEDGRVHPVRWLLLEANRYAVTLALLSLVFGSLMAVGTIWTFQMQRLLTETQAVQRVLTSLLRGIILLVSIVVSINSVVLSHDLTSVETQKGRIESVTEYRQRIGELAETDRNPVDPASFLSLMATVIPRRADELRRKVGVDDADSEIVTEIDEYTRSLRETASGLDRGSPRISGAEFGVLWNGLDFNYGKFLDWSDMIRRNYERDLPSEVRDQLDEVDHTLELFAVGKEYFKTLYYSQEMSQLSLVLLVIALPAILINASAILAVNAGILPGGRIFGLPPLLTFVAATFTISLAPYVVLTSFMLRLATVAKETASAGPFSLRN